MTVPKRMTEGRSNFCGDEKQLRTERSRTSREGPGSTTASSEL